MLLFKVLRADIEGRVMVDDELPESIGAGEVLLDPGLQGGIGRVDVDIGVQAEKVCVGVVERVICLTREAWSCGLVEGFQSLCWADQRGGLRRVRAVERHRHGGVVGQRVRVLREIGDGVFEQVSPVDVMVCNHGIERYGAQQRCPEIGSGFGAVVDGEEIACVLVVEAAFVHIVSRIHDKVGAGFVSLIRDRAVTDVAKRIITKRDKARFRAARFSGVKIAFCQRLTAASDTVVVRFVQAEAGQV